MICIILCQFCWIFCFSSNSYRCTEFLGTVRWEKGSLEDCKSDSQVFWKWNSFNHVNWKMCSIICINWYVIDFCSHEGEMYKSLLSDYEASQKSLMLENAELKKVLQQMKKEMIHILSPRSSSGRGATADDSLEQVFERDTHTHTPPSGRWVWKDWWFSYGQETIQMVNHEAVQGFVVNYFRSLEVGINMILSQYYCEFLFYFFNAILYVAISLQSDRVKLVITCNKFLMRQKLTVIVKNITSNPVYRKSHLTITFPLAAGWVKFSRVVLTDKASFKLMETR